MRFPPDVLDEIRARLSVSQVVARKVALKRAGREHRGLSPFKTEKSPSFFVNDQKGFYHCFASGEHGDIFTFLMKTEGLSFPEAVERLAGEAGVRLPAPTASERDVEHQDQRQRLLGAMQTAAAFYRTALASGGGNVARRYVTEQRRLSLETIAEFEIGYAPNSRSALREHLATKGTGVADMIAAGLLIAGDDIPVAYDRFRHRVMFPIHDLSGRLVAFGGRALDADQPAKYLNSPETPLFHKGNLLFNAHRARKAAHDTGHVIVVEGYMDVIALSAAGFKESVAPLGTALTEAQAALLWRLAPEPILCFDGDSAGRKAAFRAIDTVLPHLKPGVSLRFAFLPDGQDPDDLVRNEGAQAFAAVIERTRPLADILFEREFQAGDWTTPERRAQLESTLKELVARIADPTVRGHYERDVRSRLWQAFNGRSGGPGARANPGKGNGQGQGARGRTPGKVRSVFDPVLHAPPSGPLRESRLVAPDTAAQPAPDGFQREALILAPLLNNPQIIDAHAEKIAALRLATPAFARLRDGILAQHAGDISLDSVSLRTQLTQVGLAGEVKLVDQALTHRGDRFALAEATLEDAEAGWQHTVSLHERQTGLEGALAAALDAYCQTESEVDWARIAEIQRELMLLDDADRGGLPGM